MDYLTNSFNLSVHNNPDNQWTVLINSLSLGLFYHIVIESCKTIQKIDKKERTSEKTKMLEYIYRNVFEDNTINNNTKKQLMDLLDINSLDRHYILYYIFKLEGATDKIENVKNNYNLACNICNEDNIHINLDENAECNYQIALDDEYECNIAHVKFISWLYYSGIYTYLIDNDDLKQYVLDLMNSNQLLKGNLFLKYQLYLIKKMEIINEEEVILDNVNNINSTGNQDITDNQECEKSNNNQDNEPVVDAKGILEEGKDNIQDETNEIPEEEEEEDDILEEDHNEHDSDNNEELNKRSIREDLDNLNEAAFASKLLIAVKNITIKSIKGFYTIVRQEIDELFHNTLD